jgi:hypothetical protein
MPGPLGRKRCEWGREVPDDRASRRADVQPGARDPRGWDGGIGRPAAWKHRAQGGPAAGGCLGTCRPVLQIKESWSPLGEP